MKRKHNPNNAMMVSYETEMYGPTKTIVLCQDHRDKFYSAHPNARGNGKYLTETACELCKRSANWKKVMQ